MPWDYEPSRYAMYALLSGMPVRRDRSRPSTPVHALSSHGLNLAAMPATDRLVSVRPFCRPALLSPFRPAQMTNYLIRGALPSLIPLIAEAQGWSEAQIAMLLSAFFPGYLLTNVPSGWAAQRFGGKLMLTLNMAGSVICLLGTPRMAAAGAWPLAINFLLMGACQGSMMPAKSAMQQTWLPQGVERVWATRFMSLGGRVAQLAAVALTPRIATSYGWRWVPKIYGGVTGTFMVIWQFFAANAPKEYSRRMLEKRAAGDPSSGKTVEWRIFRQRSVQAIIASHIAWNNSNYTADQW
eukprot:SAG22_NODE_19_length_32182_cov_39.206963_20_plen_296_part_00